MLNIKPPNRHTLKWMVAIKEYGSYMSITHRPGKLHKNADGFSRMTLPKSSENLAWEPEDMHKEETVMGITLQDLSEEFFPVIAESH